MDNLTNMYNMFYGAKAFDQNLDDWKEHFTLDATNKAIATKANAQITLNKTDAFVGSKLAVAGQELDWY